MDEDHQEDGEQDEEEGQGSETYAAQSNKVAKKVKNFTEVMQRPDSAFCASKARRKQQLARGVCLPLPGRRAGLSLGVGVWRGVCTPAAFRTCTCTSYL